MAPDPSFTIRAATAADAGTLSRLRIALFQELGQHPQPAVRVSFLPASEVAFAKGLSGGFCHAWLAESDAGEPIGSVAMLIAPKLPSPVSLATQEGYLLNVYTVPAWRRRGVAAGLAAAALIEARRLGLARVRLHATAAGQPVYAAAGFRMRDDEMELRLSD
jgi:GNAT superfamily N-acetyltransferase